MAVSLLDGFDVSWPATAHNIDRLRDWVFSSSVHPPDNDDEELRPLARLSTLPPQTALLFRSIRTGFYPGTVGAAAVVK